MPFLIAEAMLSNIGGAATLVGDPPNIMIGSAGGIDFTQFLVHMGPPVSVVWIGTVGLLLFLFRKELASGEISKLDMGHKKAIKDAVQLRRTLYALSLIVLLFFVHHHLHIYPA